MRIGIIAAMEDEVAELRSHLESPRVHQHGKFHYYSGNLRGHEVVILLCGIGKVNAAVGATLLIEIFRPGHVINTGVAGGIADDLAVGDVVISTEVRHHDADATIFHYEYGQIPRMPAAYQADKTLIELASKSYKKQAKARIVKGMIMSGDSFIYHPSQIEIIRARFPAVLAVEMEGAAIAQTCYLFGIPFVIIRSISDKAAGEHNEQEYKKSLTKAARASAEMVLNLLGRLHSEVPKGGM